MDSPNRWNFLAAIVLGVAAAFLSSNQEATAQTPAPSASSSAENSLKDVDDGLTIHKSSAYAGYTLVAPMNSTRTYLIDMEGRVVNIWKSQYTPALSAYLLENGNLLRPCADRKSGVGGPGAGGPGAGGRIQEFTWNGALVWDYSFGDSPLRPHHDICRLPNGNVLVVASDPKTKEQAIAAGRRPESVRTQLVPDCILEIKPTGKTTGEIVWQWHAWDHLVQDFDKQKPGYGDVSEHAELVDVNYSTELMDRMMRDPEQLAKLRSLGYVDGGKGQPDSEKDPGKKNPAAAQPGIQGGPGGGPMDGDWMHVNSVAYNAKLDQIMLSVHEFHEVWIIDHSTTTQEAASHQGGKSGKGGDLLFRWGNPKAYRSGSNADQRFFAQHNAQWIEAGLPGAGNMLVFNNGMGRPDGDYSTVDEVVLPINEQGGYDREEFAAFAPEKANWTFASSDKTSFYSSLISGAQRLPNGNTFICSGDQAILFEVTPDNQIVWQYKHPGGGSGVGGPRALPKPGELVPRFVAGALDVTTKQIEEIRELQKEVDAKVDNLLTKEQNEKRNSPAFAMGLLELSGGPPGGSPSGKGGLPPGLPRPGPRVGQVMYKFIAERLDLTGNQKNELAALQRKVDERFGKLWTEKQKAKLKEMEQAYALGAPFGPPSGSPSGNAPSGGPPGASLPGVGVPTGPGGIFRSYRYGVNYPAFKGRDLEPGEKLDVVAKPTGGSPPSGLPGGAK
jgi:hypothetical protein